MRLCPSPHGHVLIRGQLCVIKNGFLERFQANDLEDSPCYLQMTVQQSKKHSRNKRSHSQPCSRLLSGSSEDSPLSKTGSPGLSPCGYNSICGVPAIASPPKCSAATSHRNGNQGQTNCKGFSLDLSEPTQFAHDLVTLDVDVPEQRIALPFAQGMMGCAVASKRADAVNTRKRPPKVRRLRARRLAELLLSAGSEAQEILSRETEGDLLLYEYTLEVLYRLRLESRGICTKCVGTGENYFGKLCSCGTMPLLWPLAGSQARSSPEPGPH